MDGPQSNIITPYLEPAPPGGDGGADVVEAGLQPPELHLDLRHGVPEVGEGRVVRGALALQLPHGRLVDGDVLGHGLKLVWCSILNAQQKSKKFDSNKYLDDIAGPLHVGEGVELDLGGRLRLGPVQPHLHTGDGRT